MHNLNYNVHENGGVRDYNAALFSALQRVTTERTDLSNVYYGDIGVGLNVPFFLGCRKLWQQQRVFLTMHDGPMFNAYPFSGLGLTRVVQSLANRTLGRMLNRILLKRATGIIVLSRKLRDRLVRMGVSEARVLCVPHFIYGSQEPLIETKSVVFYVLGYVRSDKCIETTLAIADTVRRKGCDVEIRFVGSVRDSALYARCVSFIEENGIKHSHVSPVTVEEFGRHINTTGFAVFDYKRVEISGSGSLMHALGAGLYCFVREGSILCEYLDGVSGETFSVVESVVPRIFAAVNAGKNSVSAAQERRLSNDAKFSLDTIARQIVQFIDGPGMARMEA